LVVGLVYGGRDLGSYARPVICSDCGGKGIAMIEEVRQQLLLAFAISVHSTRRMHLQLLLGMHNHPLLLLDFGFI
jgi:hypothetical protein